MYGAQSQHIRKKVLFSTLLVSRCTTSYKNSTVRGTPLSLGTRKFFASCTSNSWGKPSHLHAKITRTPVHGDIEATLATTVAVGTKRTKECLQQYAARPQHDCMRTRQSQI